ncbi:Transcription factor CP2 [Gryllus bimaculatus]|nr:Transcription factor CP2 [Gryllus bimaculatus]
MFQNISVSGDLTLGYAQTNVEKVKKRINSFFIYSNNKHINVKNNYYQWYIQNISSPDDKLEKIQTALFEPKHSAFKISLPFLIFYKQTKLPLVASSNGVQMWNIGICANIKFLFTCISLLSHKSITEATSEVSLVPSMWRFNEPVLPAAPTLLWQPQQQGCCPRRKRGHLFFHSPLEPTEEQIQGCQVLASQATQHQAFSQPLALSPLSIAPSLTLYLCVEEQSPVYRALYLHSLSYAEFVGKLANLVGVPVSQLSDVLLQGPAGIHVLLTDDVIRNVRNETRFMLEVLPDTNHDQYRLLLKPTQ